MKCPQKNDLFGPKKVALVSGLIPQTHYSRYLAEALENNVPEISMCLLTDKSPQNLELGLGHVVLCWDKSPLYIWQICRAVHREGIRVVHLQHEINMFGGLLTAALFPVLGLGLKLMRRRLVVTFHAVPSPQQVNSTFIRIFMGSAKRLPESLVRLFFQILFRSYGICADRIIVHTPGLKEILVRAYAVVSEKVEVIPHGIPERPYQSASPAKKFVLSFGYLHKRKNLEMLLEAVSQLKEVEPEFKLVFAGGTLQSAYEEQLKLLVRNLSIEGMVDFLGFVSEERLTDLMVSAHFIILPASISIAASGPLAQALCLNKTVLASKIGVFEEEIVDGVDGFLVENSVQDWAKRMKDLWVGSNWNDVLEAGLSRKVKERAWSRIAEQTALLYFS